MVMKRYIGSELGKSGSGQVYIMEVVTAGLLIMAVMNFIATMSVPSSPIPRTTIQLKTLGEDSLRHLDQITTFEDIDITEMDPGTYRSILDYALSANNVTIVTTFLDLTFPETVSYNIYLSDGNKTVSWYIAGEITSDTATAHWIVTITDNTKLYLMYNLEGYVIDLKLIIWHEPR
jgi:hypothetical protein